MVNLEQNNDNDDNGDDDDNNDNNNRTKNNNNKSWREWQKPQLWAAVVMHTALSGRA